MTTQGEEIDRILYEFARNELHPETAMYNTKGMIDVAKEKIMQWHEVELTKARLSELQKLHTIYAGDSEMTIYPLQQAISVLTTQLKKGE